MTAPALADTLATSSGRVGEEPPPVVVDDEAWYRRGVAAYTGLNRTDADAVWSFQVRIATQFLGSEWIQWLCAEQI